LLLDDSGPRQLEVHVEFAGYINDTLLDAMSRPAKK
jgi:hypothetical protein